jgi:succinate-semialdehyde dehydrogenase / glutarate-semialdehyde dehydrogenase
MMKVRNPRTGVFDYQIQAADNADVAAAAALSRARQPAWLALGVAGRCLALQKLADAMEAAADRVVAALAIDTGRTAIAVREVMGVIGSIRSWVDKMPGLSVCDEWVENPPGNRLKHKTQLVPYALVGVISPWNFPMVLSFIDAVPALLAGSVVLIKPSEVTPRFADAMRVIIADQGLADIIGFVHGSGATGACLIDHVDVICFTGSVATGRKVAVRAAENMIPAHLELGGKDPLIITASANVDTAASLALRSSVLATGMACQSIERIYVPRSMYHDFLTRLCHLAERVTLNYPDIDSGDLGPFIFAGQADIVRAQIVDAIAKGATVLTGGQIMDHGGGRWMAPTVLRDVDHDMDIMRDETFGPVMPIMPYYSIDEAIALANDTGFGLSAGVFAGAMAEAEMIGRQIDAGGISLMDAALTGQYREGAKDSFKNSGLGRSRMGDEGFTRFFRQKALIGNVTPPFTLAAQMGR